MQKKDKNIDNSNTCKLWCEVQIGTVYFINDCICELMKFPKNRWYKKKINIDFCFLQKHNSLQI